MYGMINNALEDFVTQRLGEDTWLRLADAAGVEDGIFVSLETYPDDVTFALVGGAATALGLTVEAFLVDFGRHWIAYAKRTAYRPLLEGPLNFTEALTGLDDMHKIIRRTLPNVKTPFFRFSVSPTGGTLRYCSSRSGLAPFVVGLLHGLAELHDIKLTIGHTILRAPDTDFDEFELQFKP
jgi:hypothetical protein